MKRSWYFISVFLLMGLTAWAQGANTPFDLAKSERELEIMRGIFKTTLSLNSEDSQKDTFFNFADIRFLYLAGQGANFYVQNLGFSPPSIVRGGLRIQLDESALAMSLERMEENLKTVYERLKEREMAVEEYPSARKSDEEAKAEAKQQKDWEAQKEKMLEQQKDVQLRIQAQNKKLEKQQEDRRQKLPEIKESLIEAVANYGDSLTTVKSDEYINLVFDTSGQYEVVSFQKSWIKDFKAGNLTLDQFKNKAIQYSMKGR